MNYANTYDCLQNAFALTLVQKVILDLPVHSYTGISHTGMSINILKNMSVCLSDSFFGYVLLNSI